MTDIILGMGEVGETLFDLLVDRKFDCIGIDLDDSKCKNYTENEIIENPQYLHVCLPGELEKFTDIVIEWVNKIKNIQVAVIHSTVKPGTTKPYKKNHQYQFYFHQFVGYIEGFRMILKNIQNLFHLMV